MQSTYASAPRVVGEHQDEGHSPAQCPVEETRCPVVAHDCIVVDDGSYRECELTVTPDQAITALESPICRDYLTSVSPAAGLSPCSSSCGRAASCSA